MPTDEQRARHAAAQRRYREKNRDYYRQKNRESHARRRASILESLGGCCTECGEIEGLEVDHMLGDGKALRDAAGCYTAHMVEIESDLASGRNTYHVQLLCHPCHVAKGEHGRPKESYVTTI